MWYVVLAFGVVEFSVDTLSRSSGMVLVRFMLEAPKLVALSALFGKGYFARRKASTEREREREPFPIRKLRAPLLSLCSERTFLTDLMT